MSTTRGEAPSLGATLYYLATGESAFEAETATTTSYRLLHDEPDLSGLDGRVKEVVAACLEKSPDNRANPAQIISLCEAQIGAVRTGAYFEIAQATEAIRDRIEALTTIMRERVQPPPAHIGPPGPRFPEPPLPSEPPLSQWRPPGPRFPEPPPPPHSAQSVPPGPRFRGSRMARSSQATGLDGPANDLRLPLLRRLWARVRRNRL